MKINRKLWCVVLLSAPALIIFIAAFKPADEHYVNLKVLPKNISSKDLQKVMVDDFEDGLGVACNFCHKADTTTGQLDFAADGKPEKEIARAMMRMTIGLNKKYFKMKHPMLGAGALTVTCNTCHNGVPFPESHN